MAIVRTAGTEIIRCINIEDVGSASRTMILGEAHHIYTVLSIVCQARAVYTSDNFIQFYIVGFDSSQTSGGTADEIYLLKHYMNLNETFVWDNKFSMNGFEPTAFTGPMDSVAEQDAIADQGSNVPQKLMVSSGNANNQIDVVCTFIDQNNE